VVFVATGLVCAYVCVCAGACVCVCVYTCVRVHVPKRFCLVRLVREWNGRTRNEEAV